MRPSHHKKWQTIVSKKYAHHVTPSGGICSRTFILNRETKSLRSVQITRKLSINVQFLHKRQCSIVQFRRNSPGKCNQLRNWKKY